MDYPFTFAETMILIGTITTSIISIRSNKVIKGVSNGVDAVHTLVNDKATQQDKKIEQLQLALKQSISSNIDIETARAVLRKAADDARDILVKDAQLAAQRLKDNK